METTLKRIVVTGPESTGKSTLCEQLAGYYDTVWCPEYAREYLNVHGTGYSYADLLTIAKGQLALEDEMAARARNGLLFVDTDMNVMKIWSEYVYNTCEPWILDQIARRRYDLYLLCDTDLPWQEDPLREYPDFTIRRQLFHTYKDSLINQSVPWALIQGQQEERLIRAREAVERVCGVIKVKKITPKPKETK